MNYTPQFFAAQHPIALRSAEIVLPGVLAELGVTTVVDVGCGVAAWASVAKAHGCTVKAVDGHVEERQLLVSPEEFERADLSAGYDCSGFDLAVCLEVGEHLPAASSAVLVAGLCEARYVLFSGAHPGQGGVDHINEQWGSWWENLFNEHDYLGYSELKWRHWGIDGVADYYRENLILFIPRLDAVAYQFGKPGVVDVIHPCRTGLWP